MVSTAAAASAVVCCGGTPRSTASSPNWRSASTSATRPGLRVASSDREVGRDDALADTALGRERDDHLAEPRAVSAAAAAACRDPRHGLADAFDRQPDLPLARIDRERVANAGAQCVLEQRAASARRRAARPRPRGSCARSAATAARPVSAGRGSVRTRRTVGSPGTSSRVTASIDVRGRGHDAGELERDARTHPLIRLHREHAVALRARTFARAVVSITALSRGSRAPQYVTEDPRAAAGPE